MRTLKFIFPVVTILALAFLITSNKSPMEKDFEKQWKKADSLSNLGQPRSALEVLNEIANLAQAENNLPQIIKTALYRIKLTADFEEDFSEKAIAEIKNRLETAKSPEKQILNSILGELYKGYFEDNRYKILDRTSVNADLEDIKTWNADKILTEANNYYLASLEDSDELQKIRIETFGVILLQEKGSKKFRPTLFDFLAYRAYDFFNDEESGLTKPSNQFKISSTEFFSPAEKFAKIPPPNEAILSNDFYATRILQLIIAFHQTDNYPQALIDADLTRLRYVHENSVIENKDSLYIEALIKLEETFKTSPHSATVMFEIARFYQEQGNEFDTDFPEKYRWDLKKASGYCEKAMNAFPESDGAKNCGILLESIHKPTIGLIAEKEVLPGKPSLIKASWKNFDKLYYRILKLDFDKYQKMVWSGNTRETLESLLKETPAKEWQVALPDSGDFQQHSAEVTVPAVNEGFYIVLAANRRDFKGKDLEVVWADFWSTNLSYINQRNDGGGYRFYVLHREKGTPLANVKINAYSRDYDYRTRNYSSNLYKSFVSDENGMFLIPAEGAANSSKSITIEFVLGNDRLVTENRFYIGKYSAPEVKPEIKTFFFTDRSIYRPGQTVYFKAIVLEKTREKFEIKPKFSTIVGLFDVNSQKVSSLNFQTNDFGSVNGSFIIPTTGLNGLMTIVNESGSVQFSVEDYKRPTFEVTFDPVKESFKLDQNITLVGQAKAYAGNAVDGAKVSYRVVRNSIFPFRYFYWPIFPSSPEMEIANGETTTDENGKFSVTFKAIPDPTTDKKYKPVFNFTLTATVADISGETQLAVNTVAVGYQALFVDVDVAEMVDQQQNIPFKISATNLNGQKQVVDLTVEIFKLKQPERLMITRLWECPDEFLTTRENFIKQFPNRIFDKENDPETWEKGEVALALKQTVNTGADSVLKIENLAKWGQGKYLVRLSAKDIFGNEVTNEEYFTLFNPLAAAPPLATYDWFEPLKTSGEPGEVASFLLGTSAKGVKMLYEIQNKGQIIKSEWLKMDREQKVFNIPILEDYRGNFSVQVSFVKDGRVFQNSMVVNVPYSNKKLDLAFETSRSDLEPGGKEKWTVTIRNSKGEKVAAEMLASMYDASLDAFMPHSWSFDLFGADNRIFPWSEGGNFSVSNGSFYDFSPQEYHSFKQQEYDRLNWFGYGPGNFMVYDRQVGGAARYNMSSKSMATDSPGMAQEMAVAAGETAMDATAQKTSETEIQEAAAKKQTFAGIQLRRDFKETAFFYPDLKTNKNGDFVIEFTLPESFTKWKFMSLAHAKDLSSGMLMKEFTAAKKLMVVPNAPRFLRQADTLFFSAKVVNLSDLRMKGTAQLEFFDAISLKPVNAVMNLVDAEKDFTIEAGQSSVVKWKIIVPDDFEILTYRVKAVAGNFTDGEEKTLPVLSNRMLVTESLPMPVNGQETKKFEFKKLIDSGKNNSLKNYRLTLEFASNPAWYAVQALPALSEPAYKNSISVSGTFFANSIAFYLANSDPKIKRVFESWKNQSPESLLSNLEKNQDLKNLLLEQTPWVLNARNESERKQRIALLFDINTMQNRLDASITLLEKFQTPNGGFTWFEGMPDSRYITQHVMEIFGKLNHLGIIDAIADNRINEMMTKATRYLDNRIREDFEELKKFNADKMNENHLSASQIHYLYVRSFSKKIMMNPNCEMAFNYYKSQSAKYWNKQGLHLQGLIAATLQRYDDKTTAALIVKSLKERSLTYKEMGMYWRQERGYFWYESPIEMQATMIEVFDEVADDQESVEKMKIWLLKQKQTQDWETSRATVEAIYALLGRGANLLASDEPAKIEIGGQPLSKEKIGKTEAGTGYFQTSWEGAEISPNMGKVTVSKPDKGVAWGALYWQYFQDLDKITPHETPLSLKKQLFVQKNTQSGPVLEPLIEKSVIKTGDKVVVRIELRVDRDLEFVHMKDLRASAFEPVNVISGYKYQDGLGYYESPRDAATNFFFDYLRKGTYVFEYTLLASQTGDFSNGITTIQCMYAPEFTSHSEGIRVKVE